MPPTALLIVRTSALGDVVHSLPVLRVLRRAWPQTRLAWVVEEAFAPLLRSHPDLDEVIPVRLRPWRQRLARAATWREIGELVARLRAFRAEVAVDLMGNHKAALLTRLSGARLRLGARRADRREPSSALWINRPVALQGAHAVDRALSLLTALGLEPGPADFAGDRLLPDPPAAARRFREEHPEPYLLIQAGAGWGNKRYPAARWGAVTRQLAAATGLAAWVLAAPGEERLAAEVAEASAGAARPLEAGGWPRLAALLRGAALVLGGDTGPLHLAHALGVPVLAVMGPTDPVRHGPYGRPDLALWQRLPCSFCHRRFPEAKACLWEVPAEGVVERALGVLRSIDPAENAPLHSPPRTP